MLGRQRSASDLLAPGVSRLMSSHRNDTRDVTSPVCPQSARLIRARAAKALSR